jgi:hypothetical protein
MRILTGTIEMRREANYYSAIFGNWWKGTSTEYYSSSTGTEYDTEFHTGWT